MQESSDFEIPDFLIPDFRFSDFLCARLREFGSSALFPGSLPASRYCVIRSTKHLVDIH